MLVYQILASTINVKTYKFKKSAPMWNDKFELPDNSYSLCHTFKVILSILSEKRKQ